MKVLCRIFGHKWQKNNELKQDCLRKNCLAFRVVVQSPCPKMFEPLCKWKIFEDIRKYKLP